jgi:hypothetical protein
VLQSVVPALLNGGRLLETVRIDTAQQLVLQVHVIERGHNLATTASSGKK